MCFLPFGCMFHVSWSNVCCFYQKRCSKHRVESPSSLGLPSGPIIIPLLPPETRREDAAAAKASGRPSSTRDSASARLPQPDPDNSGDTPPGQRAVLLQPSPDQSWPEPGDLRRHPGIRRGGGALHPPLIPMGLFIEGGPGRAQPRSKQMDPTLQGPLSGQKGTQPVCWGRGSPHAGSSGL